MGMVGIEKKKPRLAMGDMVGPAFMNNKK